MVESRARVTLLLASRYGPPSPRRRRSSTLTTPTRAAPWQTGAPPSWSNSCEAASNSW